MRAKTRRGASEFTSRVNRDAPTVQFPPGCRRDVNLDGRRRAILRCGPASNASGYPLRRDGGDRAHPGHAGRRPRGGASWPARLSGAAAGHGGGGRGAGWGDRGGAGGPAHPRRGADGPADAEHGRPDRHRRHQAGEPRDRDHRGHQLHRRGEGHRRPRGRRQRLPAEGRRCGGGGGRHPLGARRRGAPGRGGCPACLPSACAPAATPSRSSR